jgi:hypothetical protein
MKKFLSLILLLASLSFSFVGTGPRVVSSTGSWSYRSNADSFIQFETLTDSIATGSVNFISFTVDNVLDYDSIDFTIESTDGDAITTASVTWESFAGKTWETSVLTSGTPITVFLSERLTFTIPNPSANAVTIVSANVRLVND